MALPSFFTIPDDDLTSESSVDPMGILVIWTEYGQAIFNNRITTIANDMRVFHFNLFHSYILYRLEHDYQAEIENAIERYSGLRNERDFKAGMYIFLEDLVNHVFTYTTRSNVNKEGILGINKAKAKAVDGAGKTTLSVNKNGGLLIKQATYGMMGRYRGPFISLNLFNRNYEFIDENWIESLELMSEWKQGKKFADTLIRFIRTELLQGKKTEYPSINLQSLMDSSWWKSIHDGYLDCFGAKKLEGPSADFWIKQLGFRDGAAAAIYKAIKKETKTNNYNVRSAFESALSICKEEPEKKKIKNILGVEDFLSHCEYIFRFICNSNVKQLDDCKGEIEIIRNKIRNTRIDEFASTNKRLAQLRSVALQEGSTENWLEGMITYHKKIMEARGGTTWVELTPEHKFRHYYNVALRTDIAKVNDYVKAEYWMHDYYYGAILTVQGSMN